MTMRYAGGVIFIVVVLSCQQVTGLDILDPCTDSASCPDNGLCELFGCRNQVCVCVIGFKPSEDGKKCLRVLDMGDDCTQPNTTCRFGMCNGDGQCACPFGTFLHEDKARCVKEPYTNQNFRLLGDACDDVTDVCFDALTQTCNNSVCECKTGHKETTEAIYSALPSANECVPEDLDIGTTINQSLCVEVRADEVVPIGAECLYQSDCPTNSTCSVIGCKKICTCQSGTAPNIDMTACLTVAYLGEVCDGVSVTCVTINSFCFNDECICNSGFEKTDENLCRELSALPGVYQMATMNETCGGTTECDSGLVCIANKCTCKSNWREASVEERLQHNLNSYCIHSAISPTVSQEDYSSLCVENTVSPSSSATPTSTAASSAAVSSSSVSNVVSSTTSPSATTSASLQMLSSDTSSISTSPSSSLPTSSQVPSSSAMISSTKASSSLMSSSTQASSSVMISSTQISSSLISSSTQASSSVISSSTQSSQASSSASLSASSSVFSSASSSSLPSTSSSQTQSLSTSSTAVVSSSTTSSSASLPSSSSVAPSPSSTSSAPSTSVTPPGITTTVTPPGITTTVTPPDITTTVTPPDITTTAVPTLSVYEECENNTQCPNNADCKLVDCTTYRCLCRANYSADTSNKYCQTTAKLGETCSNTITCATPGSACATSGTCECGGATPERSTDNRYCVQSGKKLIGESCGNGECMGVMSTCANGVCECTYGRVATQEEIDDNPDVWFTLAQCRPASQPTPSPSQSSGGQETVDCTPLKPGDNCSSSVLCPENSKCLVATGGCEKRCWCDVGYAPDKPVPTKCIPVVPLGSACQDGQQKCRGMGTFCKSGVCTCMPPSFKETDDGKFCQPTVPYITISMLGGPCDMITKFCANHFEQTCESNVCECKTGFEPATEKDLDAKYMMMDQCRNSSLSEGYRPTLTCIEPPIALVQEPDYTQEIETARAAQTQTVVFVAVPTVVIVCIVAAAFTLLRYRRRRSQLSEDGSSVSEEGSTIFGIQIPRPSVKLFHAERNWSEANNVYQKPTFVVGRPS